MRKHKHLGFTVVELIVVIVVIAVLVSITAIAYRTTQADSRNKKRQADVTMLQAALDEYYSDNGRYPQPTGCEYSTARECVSGQAWNLLRDEGYLQKVPMPDLATTHHTSGVNRAPDGKAYYLYFVETPSIYSIYVPMETNNDCKVTNKSAISTMWSSAPICNF